MTSCSNIPLQCSAFQRICVILLTCWEGWKGVLLSGHLPPCLFHLNFLHLLLLLLEINLMYTFHAHTHSTHYVWQTCLLTKLHLLSLPSSLPKWLTRLSTRACPEVIAKGCAIWNEDSDQQGTYNQKCAKHKWWTRHQLQHIYIHTYHTMWLKIFNIFCTDTEPW